MVETVNWKCLIGRVIPKNLLSNYSPSAIVQNIYCISISKPWYLNIGTIYEENPSSQHGGMHQDGRTDWWIDRPGAFLYSSKSAIMDAWNSFNPNCKINTSLLPLTVQPCWSHPHPPPARPAAAWGLPAARSSWTHTTPLGSPCPGGSVVAQSEMFDFGYKCRTF